MQPSVKKEFDLPEFATNRVVNVQHYSDADTTQYFTRINTCQVLRAGNSTAGLGATFMLPRKNAAFTFAFQQRWCQVARFASFTVPVIQIQPGEI